MRKKSKYILIILSLLLLLGACSDEIGQVRETYTAYDRGVGYKVDTVNMTVTQEGGENVFTYVIEDMTVTITYPDGSTYWWTVTDMGGYGGWSDNYDEEKYISGEKMLNILSQVMPEVETTEGESRSLGMNGIFGIIFILLGIFYVLKPAKAWYMSVGWQFKDATPSDKAIGYYRAGGVFIILIGIFMIIM